MIFIVQQWSVRTERTLAYTKLVTLTTNELPANVIVLTGNSRWSHSRLRKEGWSHSRQIELPACAIVLTGKPRPLVTPTAVGCPQRNCVDWKPGQVPADLRAARTPRGWSHPGTTWNRRITADHRGGRPSDLAKITSGAWAFSKPHQAHGKANQYLGLACRGGTACTPRPAH